MTTDPKRLTKEELWSLKFHPNWTERAMTLAHDQVFGHIDALHAENGQINRALGEAEIKVEDYYADVERLRMHIADHWGAHHLDAGHDGLWHECHEASCELDRAALETGGGPAVMPEAVANDRS